MRARLAEALKHRAVPPLLAASVLIIGFVVIVRGVRGSEPTAFDMAVAQWVHSFDAPWLDGVLTLVTELGSIAWLIAVAAAVSVYLWMRGAQLNAAVVAGTSLLGGVLNGALKRSFERARPELFAKVSAPGFSFPSGHAMGTTVVFGISAVAFGVMFPKHRVRVFSVAVPLIFIIGLSRVYLGVHWPTDVLGGFLAGSALVIAASSALRRPSP